MKYKSLNRLQTAMVLVFIITFAATTDVVATPFGLKPLNATQSLDKAQSNGLDTIIMIFQPECSWCKKQGKLLAKAFQQCQSSINISLIGTQGNTRQLRKELKYYYEAIPAFIADRQFLRSIGGYQASPTTLVYDSKGELIAKKRGFIPEDKLASVLAIVTQGACLI